jgi:hypothetical protein
MAHLTTRITASSFTREQDPKRSPGIQPELTRGSRQEQPEDGQQLPTNGKHDAVLKWNVAEKILMDHAKGDVVVILDACFAGNMKEAIPQRDLGRAYEVLAACPPGKSTAPPGSRSFTNSLVHCLKEMVDTEPSFTVSRLFAAIGKRAERQGRPADFWSRSSNQQRSIRLAPLPKSADEPDLSPTSRKRYFDEKQIPQYLNIRIELKKDGQPSQDEIEDLAHKVSLAVKDAIIPTRRVDYVSIESRAKQSFRRVVQFVGHLTRWRRSPMLEKETSPTFENPVATLADVLAQAGQAEPEPSRKRCRSPGPSDASLGPPAKRRASGSTIAVVDFANEQQPLTPKSGRDSTPKS